MANGHETITIDKKDENSIFGRNGLALPADKFAQPVRLKNVPVQIIGATLAEDNSYLDVRFNAGVYGAPIYDGRGHAGWLAPGPMRLSYPAPAMVAAQLAADNRYLDVSFNLGVYGDAEQAMPVAHTDFRLLLQQNGGKATAVNIIAAAEPNGTSVPLASPLTGGETVLAVVQMPSGHETIQVLPANGQAIFSSSRAAASAEETTGEIYLNSYYPQLVRHHLDAGWKYIDVTFNGGVYGADQGPALPESFTLALDEDQALPEEQRFRLLSWRLSQSSSDSPFVRGETTLRFWLETSGEPSGREIFQLIFHSNGSPITAAPLMLN